MPGRSRRKAPKGEDEEVVRMPGGSVPPGRRRQPKGSTARSASAVDLSMRASLPNGFESAVSPLEQAVIEHVWRLSSQDIIVALVFLVGTSRKSCSI
jgi:hypothetical protein